MSLRIKAVNVLINNNFFSKAEGRKIGMYVFQILRDVWEHKASVIYSRLHMELGVCHKLSIPDKTHIWVIDYLISHGVKYMVHI